MKNLDEMNEERRLSKPRNTTFLYILEIRRRRLLCKGSVVLNRASLKGRHDEIQGISISARFQLPPVSPLYLSCASSLETEVKGSFQGHGSNWDHLLACISLFLFFFLKRETIRVGKSWRETRRGGNWTLHLCSSTNWTVIASTCIWYLVLKFFLSFFFGILLLIRGGSRRRLNRFF